MLVVASARPRGGTCGGRRETLPAFALRHAGGKAATADCESFDVCCERSLLMNRRDALKKLAAAAGVVALSAVRAAAVPPRRWVAVCATSPCRHRNAGKVGPSRATHREARQDALD